MIQKQQSLELEELQRRQQQKLRSQLQTLEEVLSERAEKMEQVTVAVEKLEEQRHFLLADQQQCAFLQDRVVQLSEFGVPFRCCYISCILLLTYKAQLAHLLDLADFQTQFEFILRCISL